MQTPALVCTRRKIAGSEISRTFNALDGAGPGGRRRLVVVAVGALACAVFDPVDSSTSSTSEAGPVSSPWPWLRSVPCSMMWPVPCLIRWPAPPARPGRCCALVVIAVGAALDAVARWPAPPDPAAKPGRRRRLGHDRGRRLGRCRIRSGGQLHQIQERRWAGAVTLAMVAVGALAGAVFDLVASSTSSTSEAGPVSSPWS
jgi:hypothetical protein